MTSTSKLSTLISGTRRRILEYLLKSDVNAVTLAELLNINISAIRSHLDVLEIAGLVSSRHEHANRGRPKRIYFLTELAYSLFPNQTNKVFSALIQAIIRSFDMKTTNSLIRRVIAQLWQEILPDKPSGSLQDQLAFIVQALDDFGFYASLESIKDQYAIVIRNDVFLSALSTLPKAQAVYFRKEFWNRLSRIVEGIHIRLAEPPDPNQHGFRVLVKEKKGVRNHVN